MTLAFCLTFELKRTEKTPQAVPVVQLRCRREPGWQGHVS